MFTKFAAVLAAMFMIGGAVAQSPAPAFPVKPVTVVIGYPPGGPTDVLMRALAPHLTAEWKQPVIVDNRPGANEAIALQHVAKAPADGHTLFLGTEVPLTLNPLLMSKLPYNAQKDFKPVSMLMVSPMALVVPASSPANTLEEFIALAKQRTAAGKPLAYGSGGPGGVLHLPMAMLAKQNDLTMTHVPYKGVAPLLTDVVSGQVDAAWCAVAGIAPFVREGRMKALVIGGTTSRVKALPNVPVFSETKVKEVQADHIFALMAPAGTPAGVAERIATSFRNALADGEVRRNNLDPFGFVVVATGPMDLQDYLAKDRVRQAERVKVSGATMD